MKRCFSEPDGIIPPALTSVRSTLDRLVDIETSITERWIHHQRVALASCIEPEVKSKICRIYVRHQFYPATSSEDAHFLIRFEGNVLDPKYKTAPSVSSLHAHIPSPFIILAPHLFISYFPSSLNPIIFNHNLISLYSLHSTSPSPTGGLRQSGGSNLDTN